jgi:hypothetical protein
VGRELRGASTTADEASTSTAMEREGHREGRERAEKERGGEWDEWCREQEDRHVGGRAGFFGGMRGRVWWACGSIRQFVLASDVRRVALPLIKTRP